MSSRSWWLRTQDILTAISEIQQRTYGMTFAAFEDDATIVKAVLYDFIIIGEATRYIPADVKARYTHIPWRLMGQMRNVIAHEYFQIDLDTVWKTVQNDLIPLMLQLQNFLEREADNE